MSETKLRVGRKGEIYTTKQLRKALGLREGFWVKAQVQGDSVIIRRAATAEELLEKPGLASLTVRDFEKLSLRLQRRALRKKKMTG